MDGPCIPIFAYAASPQKLVCNILRISKVMGGLLTPPTNTAINLTFLRSFFCLLKFPHHTIPYFVMSSEMIEFGTLSLQTNTKCYSYYPIHNIGHVNMQNKKTHHTVHLYDILLNTITSFPSPALNSTIRIPTSRPPPPYTPLTLIKTSKKILLITLFGVLKSRYLIPPQYLYCHL